MAMNYSKKILIAVCNFIALDILIIILVLTRAISSGADNIEKLSRQKQEVLLMQERIKRFQNLSMNFLKYQKSLREMESLLEDNLFVDAQIPLDFINFLKERAKANNLHIEIFPPKIKKDKFRPKIVEQVILKGSFPSILKFLKEVEYSKWISEIETFDIEKQKKEVKAIISIAVYAKE